MPTPAQDLADLRHLLAYVERRRDELAGRGETQRPKDAEALRQKLQLVGDEQRG